MLNYLWAGMIIIGVIFASFTGKVPELTNAALDSSKEAVSLCITMVGVMSFWSGFMEIAKKAGIIESAARKLEPFLTFMFPRLPKHHPARQLIATNFIANVLGLGWAAMPAGLKAMESLGELHRERCRIYGGEVQAASNEMCTFLILNISSLQLIPVSIIAYRSQYGSPNPTAIVGPAILATLVSTVVAILFIKIKDRKHA